MSGWHLLNLSPFVTKLGMVVQQSLLARVLCKKISLSYQGQGHRACIIRIWLSSMFSEFPILLQSNFGLWYIILSRNEVSSDKIGLLSSRPMSEQRFKVSSVSMFRQCFQNYRTFCNQSWYSDPSLWTRVSCVKIGLLSSSSGAQWRLIWLKYDYFSCIWWTADPFMGKHRFVL